MRKFKMTFRVEPELRASFTEAAELAHRPAAQVLRELMRCYVNQARDLATSVPFNDNISAIERLRRENAVSFARASVGLEGFKPSKEDEEQARQFIRGDIALADFIKVKAEIKPARSR